MPRPARWLAPLALAVPLLTPARARGEVIAVEIARRDTIAGHFGAAGRYERIVGRLQLALDPRNPHDRAIVDLDRAPRDARGRVTAWSEFVLLRPLRYDRARTVGLIDVTNRGGNTLGVFHLNARRDAAPEDSAAYGDALLLRQGLVLVHVGWQWDATPARGATGLPVHLQPPPVPNVTGLVRSDVTIDTPTPTMSLGHVVGTSRALGYPVADTADAANVLTVRDTPTGARTVIPRARWRFARDSAGTPVFDARTVWLEGGFQSGKIYEVVYRAGDAVVVGAGLAAVRDVASWLKHDSTSLAPVARTVAYGVSQTGRFLRHMLYQGFTVDERGRPALDGMFAHTAGAGRGSFNHRFAQPSRDAQPYSTFFYPTDVFPFTARDGLLARVPPNGMPKVFWVDGGHEYWGRAASLSHTDVDGRRDVTFGPRERRYVIASAQHSSPGAFPPAPNARFGDAVPAWRGDPLDQRLALRALLLSLVAWVRDDAAPPPSAYPTLAAGTLVPVERVRFPSIPGIATPRVPTQAWRLDFGPRFRTQGIEDAVPPRVGAPYAVRVTQVDALGNDAAGIRSVELRAPLATYFPWQLRTSAPTDRLASFAGTFVPLPRTEAERAARRDPRPSVERLYGSRDAYLARVRAAADTLVRARQLLAEDVPVAVARMAATWDWLQSQP